MKDGKSFVLWCIEDIEESEKKLAEYKSKIKSLIENYRTILKSGQNPEKLDFEIDFYKKNILRTYKSLKGEYNELYEVLADEYKDLVSESKKQELEDKFNDWVKEEKRYLKKVLVKEKFKSDLIKKLKEKSTLIGETKKELDTLKEKFNIANDAFRASQKHKKDRTLNESVALTTLKELEKQSRGKDSRELEIVKQLKSKKSEVIKETLLKSGVLRDHSILSTEEDKKQSIESEYSKLENNEETITCKKFIKNVRRYSSKEAKDIAKSVMEEAKKQVAQKGEQLEKLIKEHSDIKERGKGILETEKNLATSIENKKNEFVTGVNNFLAQLDNLSREAATPNESKSSPSPSISSSLSSPSSPPSPSSLPSPTYREHLTKDTAVRKTSSRNNNYGLS